MGALKRLTILLIVVLAGCSDGPLAATPDVAGSLWDLVEFAGEPVPGAPFAGDPLEAGELRFHADRTTYTLSLWARNSAGGGHGSWIIHDGDLTVHPYGEAIIDVTPGGEFLRFADYVWIRF